MGTDFKTVINHKALTIFLVKSLFFAGFLYWLIKYEHFDLNKIKMGLTNFKLALIFLVLTFLQIALGSQRTKILMQFQTTSSSTLRDILSVTWASSFINCMVPTSLVGDLFKIRELMRIDTSTSKDNTIYTSIYSKVFSTLALIFLFLLSYSFLNNPPKELSSLLFYTSMLFCILSLCYVLKNKAKSIFGRFFDQLYSVSKKNFYVRRLDNFKKYNNSVLNKKIVFKSLSISCLIQTLNILSFLLIINAIQPDNIFNFLEIACVIPIGIFVMQLPISFSGFGIGHIAFSKLLNLYGISFGSDVFSVFFAFSYLFNFIGIVPLWFLLKK